MGCSVRVISNLLKIYNGIYEQLWRRIKRQIINSIKISLQLFRQRHRQSNPNSVLYVTSFVITSHL